MEMKTGYDNKAALCDLLYPKFREQQPSGCIHLIGCEEDEGSGYVLFHLPWNPTYGSYFLLLIRIL